MIGGSKTTIGLLIFLSTPKLFKSGLAINANWAQKKIVLEEIERLLISKDVLIYFNNKEMQAGIDHLGWGGEIRKTASDFLLMVDANLNSLKTDQFIDRGFEYTVDFSDSRSKATMKIKYTNNVKTKDW